VAGASPGQAALLGAGLTVGIFLLSMQLWLLAIALELYLGGHAERLWSLALVSGLIFLGGLGMLWLLRRRPRLSGRIEPAPRWTDGADRAEHHAG
jgi:hypothetical protein